jgi:signal transduction histidine kinase
VAFLVTAAPSARVMGDRVRLVQALTNLVANAMKYAPRGTAVRVSALSQGAGVRFLVRDAGPGISPEEVPNLFSRFFQGKAPLRRVMGTGLGLVIAKAIVEQHGGKIGVESTPGQGAMFWFDLPSP